MSTNKCHKVSNVSMLPTIPRCHVQTCQVSAAIQVPNSSNRYPTKPTRHVTTGKRATNVRARACVFSRDGRRAGRARRICPGAGGGVRQAMAHHVAWLGCDQTLYNKWVIGVGSSSSLGSLEPRSLKCGGLWLHKQTADFADHLI